MSKKKQITLSLNVNQRTQLHRMLMVQGRGEPAKTYKAFSLAKKIELTPDEEERVEYKEFFVPNAGIRATWNKAADFKADITIKSRNLISFLFEQAKQYQDWEVSEDSMDLFQQLGIEFDEDDEEEEGDV